MKFSRLFKESTLFWPAEIAISDGQLRSDGGGYFPTLNAVWAKVEEAQSQINDWHDLMSWAMFCGFHKAACEHLKNGDLTPVKIAEVSRTYVESIICESLMSVYPSWPKQMRSQYRNNLKSKRSRQAPKFGLLDAL